MPNIRIMANMLMFGTFMRLKTAKMSKFILGRY